MVIDYNTLFLEATALNIFSIGIDYAPFCPEFELLMQLTRSWTARWQGLGAVLIALLIIKHPKNTVLFALNFI